jgi:hypothetical protein
MMRLTRRNRQQIALALAALKAEETYGTFAAALMCQYHPHDAAVLLARFGIKLPR